jgi:hypothetical protein
MDAREELGRLDGHGPGEPDHGVDPRHPLTVLEHPDLRSV